MVENTIQTVNSPLYDTYMSTPGNTAKLGATHSNIQTWGVNVIFSYILSDTYVTTHLSDHPSVTSVNHCMQKQTNYPATALFQEIWLIMHPGVNHCQSMGCGTEATK